MLCTSFSQNLTLVVSFELSKQTPAAPAVEKKEETTPTESKDTASTEEKKETTESGSAEKK